MQKDKDSHIPDDFTALCKKHGLKITPQRKAIYSEIIKSEVHPTAEQIYDIVKLEYPNISYDTVNRTLITFVRIGLIDVIEGYGSPRRYDSNSKKHHHLHCVKCGKVIDFYNNRYDKLELPKNIPKSFEILNKRVVISGICSQCKKEDN